MCDLKFVPILKAISLLLTRYMTVFMACIECRSKRRTAILSVTVVEGDCGVLSGPLAESGLS